MEDWPTPVLAANRPYEKTIISVVMRSDSFGATKGFSYGMEDVLSLDDEAFKGGEMGLAASGKMKQKIYPDKYGVKTWDENNFGRVYVHIVNSMMYREITGKEAPPTPATAKTYTPYGFPWFDLYDEHKGDVVKGNTLSQVKSVKEMDKEKGFAPQQDDSSIEVSDEQVKKLKLKSDPNAVRDGDW